MARIYFSTEEADATVKGTERDMMGARTDATASVFFERLLRTRRHVIDELVRPEWRDELKRDDALTRAFISQSDAFPLLVWNGVDISTRTMRRNTAIASGDVMSIFDARIDGQCEIHCWIDGPDRNWFAKIIEQGIKNHHLRAHLGWADVLKLLRTSDFGEVVLSYSVCDVFSSHEASGSDMPEADWYDMDDLAQWEMCMNHLRAGDDDGLQLQPSNFKSLRFGHEIALQDFFSDGWVKKLDAYVASLPDKPVR